MTKIQTPEQFAALGQANLESLMSLAGSAIARAERLAELNLNTVRSVLEDSVATTRKLAEVKNPQELANLQAELTKPMIDKAVAYARSVQEIATEGQNEVSSLFEKQIAELTRTSPPCSTRLPSRRRPVRKVCSLPSSRPWTPPTACTTTPARLPSKLLKLPKPTWPLPPKRPSRP